MHLTKVFFIIALSMALSITLTMRNINKVEQDQQSESMQQDQVLVRPSKRVSRFLAQGKNPRAADHCHKDNDICSIVAGKNTTCCNNKCMDLSTDNKNCGACKKKCKYTETCCRGQCVNVAFDKRHCGFCNNPCKYGQYCVYGMCGYA